MLTTLLLALAPGPTAFASGPQSLTLHPKSDKNMPIPFSTQGILEVDVPDIGTIYVAPRIVDSSSGKWRSPTETSLFTQASGKEISSSASYTWETEGATTKINLKASVQSDTLNFRMDRELEGDATGHIRADVVIPYDIASRLRIENANGNLFEAGISKGGVFDPPLSFIDTATNKTLCTLESDNAKAGIIVNAEFEQRGMEVRVSNYPGGTETSVSNSSELEFTLKFQ